MNTVQQLKAGMIIDLQGIKLCQDTGDLMPGDLYVGERNTGPKLLTVFKVVYHDPQEEKIINYVIPKGPGYPFDGHEVVKVKEAI